MYRKPSCGYNKETEHPIFDSIIASSTPSEIMTKRGPGVPFSFYYNKLTHSLPCEFVDFMYTHFRPMSFSVSL